MVFLESINWESVVCNVVFLGGDVDIMVCIVGVIVEVFYGGVLVEIELEVMGWILMDF